LPSPSLTCSLNRAWLKLRAPAVVFVALDIVPPRAVRKNPVALVLALDTSASMTGRKHDHAVSAAREFSQALGARDALGVVAFDSRARTVLPLTKEPGREGVEAALERIEAGGETNLQAGLQAAMRELTKKPIAAQAAARIILLTDGQPTMGSKTPERLERQAAQLRRLGAAISTVGVGDEYNSELLTAIAGAGGGRPYHLEGDLRGLDALLGDELVEAGNVVNKGPRARVELMPGAQVLQAFTVEPMVNLVEAEAVEAGVVEVPLADLVSGSRQTVVLRVRVPPVSEGKHTLLTFEVEGAREAVAFETTEDLAVYGSETNPHARLLLTAAEGTVIARRALSSSDKTEIGRSETIVRAVAADPALRGAKHAHPSVVPLVGALGRTQDALESPSLTEGERRRVAQDATVIVRKGGGA
jgi:Ca-activated chloride channel family protein